MAPRKRDTTTFLRTGKRVLGGVAERWAQRGKSPEALAELRALRKEIALMKDYLRPPDFDGVRPPVLRTKRRKLRDDVPPSKLSGTYGPANPELVTARIYAVLLTCYQQRLSRSKACDEVSRVVPLVTSGTLASTFRFYASDAEMGYNPYARKPGR